MTAMHVRSHVVANRNIPSNEESLKGTEKVLSLISVCMYSGFRLTWTLVNVGSRLTVAISPGTESFVYYVY